MKRTPAGAGVSAPVEAPGRRRFLLGGMSAAVLAGRGGGAGLRIGLLLPPGPRAPGILRGAQMGAAEADSLARMFGKKLELVRPPVRSPEAVAGAAARLIKEGVSVLVGGGDEGTAEALREAARDGEALLLNVGSAADRLRRELCDRHMFHLHASLEMYVGAAGFWLLEEKKARRWGVLTESDVIRRAVVDLATARGATIVEAPPAVTATGDFGPLLERIQAAGPEALWVGLAARSLPGFLRGYALAGIGGELVGIMPEAAGLPELEPGALLGVWPVMWHHTLDRYSARELNSRFKRRFGERLEGASWSAWAALKLVGEALVRAGTTPRALLEYLESDPPFDGHKGRALTFRREDHQLRQPMYLARAGPAAPAGEAGIEVVAEVPRGSLDALFLPAGHGDCLATGGAAGLGGGGRRP